MRIFLIGLGIIFTGLLFPLVVVFLEHCLFEDNCLVPWANASTERGPKSALTADSNSPRQCSKPTNFEISYVFRRGSTGQAKAFSHGNVLRSGDSYKLLFKPTDNNFVYIFQIDSSHKIFRLFPTQDFANADLKNDNPVIKGTQYFVPAEQWSFQLDNTTGRETIYFVVTCQRDSALEKQYAKMVTMQSSRSIQQRHQARQAWDSAMRGRGPKPKLITDNTPQTISTLTWTEGKLNHITLPEYLKNISDGSVHIVEFDHQ